MSSLLYVDKEPKPFPYIFFVHRRRKDEEAGVAFPVDQRIYCNADWESFQELIQRGANLWPDAPPEIKDFADLVTNGKVMQDYYRQVLTTYQQRTWYESTWTETVVDWSAVADLLDKVAPGWDAATGTVMDDKEQTK